MRWALLLTRIAGIPIYIHSTFVLLVVYVFWQLETFTLASILFSLITLVLVFVSVILHELGHSITARLCGLPVEKIVLWPFGGTAHLAREPARPRHELLIAAAGPAVNLLLAGAAMIVLILTVTAEPNPFAWNDLSQQLSLFNLTLWLFMVNMFLVLFNLIPALPLDGGRILRSVLLILAIRQHAATIMKIVGWLFAGIIGLTGILLVDVFLIVVALIMAVAARHAITPDQVAEPNQATPAPATTRSPWEPVPAAGASRAQPGPASERPSATQPLDRASLQESQHSIGVHKPMNSLDRQIEFVSILNFFIAILSLLALVVSGMIMFYGIFYSGDSIDVIAMVSAFILVLMILPSAFAMILFLLAGIGLMMRRTWGYYVHIIAAIGIGLTIIGLVYTIPVLFYSLKPEFRAQVIRHQAPQLITHPAGI